MKVTILGVSKYDFENDAKERISGLSVHFINEVEDHTKKTVKGFLPTKVNLPSDAFSEFENLKYPVAAEPMLAQSLGPKGVVTKIVGFNILEPLLIKKG
jgi:hypothetical protein